MKKFSFGMTEVAASFLGAVLFAFLEWIEEYCLSMGGAIAATLCNSVQFSLVILAVTVSIYGHATGVVGAALGLLATHIVLPTATTVPSDVSVMAFVLIIGAFSDKFRVRSGAFGIQEFFDFAAVSVMACIVSDVLIAPMLSFVLYRLDFYETILKGLRSTIGNCIATVIVCGAVLGMVSAIINLTKKNNNEI